VGKVVSTLITVVVAVVVSGLLWVGANLVFNQARNRWSRFTALVFATVGFVVGMVLHGNRVTVGSGDGFVRWIWLPLLAAVVFAVAGLALEQTRDRRTRLVTGVAVGVALGVGIGLLVRPERRPELDLAAAAAWTVSIGAIGAGISALRKRTVVGGALIGAALGAVLGGWGSARLGGGSVVEALVASVVPAALVGVRLGRTTSPDLPARARISGRSRAWIFLLPAMLFIFASLVVPAIRTIYLSLLDKRSQEFVRLKNYTDTFTDPNSWDSTTWTNMFTSRLFVIGVIVLAVAAVVGVVAKRRTGRFVEVGNPTMAPLIVGILLVLFAAFTSFRGTIVNNLWWVVTVVFASTGMGLAVAVLADNVRHEKLAKSLIFMPLAISLVGASIIWRFMYVTTDASKEQRGVINALWVGLGRLSTGSGLPTFVVGALVALAIVGLAYAVYRAVRRRDYGKAPLPGVAAVLLLWLFVRYLGSGVGGIGTNNRGELVAKPISFVQEPPWNNFWLMVILIWIQTGFAMVILSAAIKAVPGELIEAARVDGATPTQIFWRITLPQISTTIGVVVTTLIVLVMKVFDIVKVVTNGQFGTQVLANEMAQQAFTNSDTGRGAALAVILFLSVLPVMYYNIRRMQKET
jgi:alpha-glucoside transport system permease protein